MDTAKPVTITVWSGQELAPEKLLGLLNFQGPHHVDWQELMACNVVASAPLILAFLFAQRQFVQTMSMHGMKG